MYLTSNKLDAFLDSKNLPPINKDTLSIIKNLKLESKARFKLKKQLRFQKRQILFNLRELNWLNIQKDLPVPKDNFGCAYTNKKIYVIGGRTTVNDSESLFQHEESLVHVLDISTQSWSTRKKMLFPHAGNAVVATTSGDIFSLGGYLKIPDNIPSEFWPYYEIIGKQGYISNIVQTYNPSSNSWTLKSPMPQNRVFTSAVTTNDGFIYVFGGYQWQDVWPDPEDPQPNIIKARDVLQYNISEDSWEAIDPMPSGRSSTAAVLGKDGLIYVLGGDDENCLWCSTVQAYNPQTHSWESKADMPTQRGGLSAVVDSDGKIYAIGGTNTADSLTTVEIYDPAINTWTAGATLPEGRMSHESVITEQDEVFVLGGLLRDCSQTVPVKKLLASTIRTTVP